METPEAQALMYAPESFWGQAGRGLERAGEFALGGELAAPVSAALKAILQSNWPETTSSISFLLILSSLIIISSPTST
jgi:hypothetical protein